MFLCIDCSHPHLVEGMWGLLLPFALRGTGNSCSFHSSPGSFMKGSTLCYISAQLLLLIVLLVIENQEAFVFLKWDDNSNLGQITNAT